MRPDCLRVPLVIRGQVVDDYARSFPTARAGDHFCTADVAAHVARLPITAPAMLDLASLRFCDVLDYLDFLSRCLVPATNLHVQRAFELSRRSSMLSDAMLREMYERIPTLFRRESVMHRASTLLGLEYLDDWLELPAHSDARTRARVRAFGARTLHIVAGNAPVIGPVTVLHNAITRGDAIIKSPWNDPLSTAAVALTMIDMARDHPLTRHVSVAYWKGGDSKVEHALYDPRHIEKIVAWGGLSGIRHVIQSLPPGVDLIALDPKQGMAVLDGDALARCESSGLRELARRLALDIGLLNQEACFSTRLVYLVGRCRPTDFDLACRLGELAFEELQALPESLSNPHPAFDPELKAELDALRMVDLGYRVFGGSANEGSIVVSPNGNPVDFAHRLAGRVANIVPVASVEQALAAVGSWTQTVSVYPDAFRDELRDRLACQGAQRIVPLGAAMMDPEIVTPQDGMELLRRMCRWVVDESPTATALSVRADGLASRNNVSSLQQAPAS